MKQIWFYGKHTCISALKNKNRLSHELLLSEIFYNQNYQQLKTYIETKNVKVRIIKTNEFNSVLSPSSNHQGIALKVSPLENVKLEEIIEKSTNESTIVILDQITDTHNIGSILRTSACFNIDALILTYKHSPCENSSIAKAASGALEMVPLLYVTNIVNTIKLLKDLGYWCYGFDCKSNQNLNKINGFCSKKVIVLGSEEKGLRRLVKENCDLLIKIPMSSAVNSLNVSNAAAIALYSVYNGNT